MLATRTSFTREDADVSQPAGLQGASSGGGALAAERPAWNPLLVQDQPWEARIDNGFPTVLFNATGA